MCGGKSEEISKEAISFQDTEAKPLISNPNEADRVQTIRKEKILLGLLQVTETEIFFYAS